MGGHLDLLPDLSHVAGDKHLQTIGFGDQPTQLLLVGGHHIRLNRLGLAQRVPVFSVERLLDTVEELRDGFESDELLPCLRSDVGPRLPKIGETLGNKGKRRGILVEVGLGQLVEAELVDRIQRR